MASPWEVTETDLDLLIQVVKADGGAQAADTLLPFAYLYFFERVRPDATA